MSDVTPVSEDDVFVYTEVVLNRLYMYTIEFYLLNFYHY